ncbi:MAG: adenylate/guanylate cyclase domain-containing protein [Saprospiraceae bacterium]|nr:adenylate/guanylate cyclase domain-containing protein [Lewinella sp.]
MNLFRSNKIQTQVRKIIWITVAWTLIALFQFFGVYTMIIEMGLRSVVTIDPLIPLKGSILQGLLAGLLGGSGMVFLWEQTLRTKTYGKSLWIILSSFTLIYFLVALPVQLYYHKTLSGAGLLDTELWQRIRTALRSLSTIRSYLFWLFVVMATLIVLLVSDKYGPGVFQDFLLGKYFHPKREERIFMFLDLRSSTTIAEQLGEERYFSFIKDVFRHATPGIIYAKGQIYQYVGDEIVISWKTEEGTENASCVRCFFEIQRRLRQEAPYYKATYGVTPEFKAGLHYGHVMTGEVGVVKRDIAFSGDVLNTTARIQAKCNELGVNILLSKPLLDQLALPPNSFAPQKIGDILLRGKKQEIMLFTV